MQPFEIAPTLNGKELTTRSAGNRPMTQMSDDELKNQFQTNIGQNLISRTDKDGVAVFAVGVGAQYHCTTVVISKNPNYQVKIGDKTYSGTNENPMIFFIEDTGAYGVYAGKDGGAKFENEMKVWVRSARGWYRHEFDYQDKKNPKEDYSIRAKVYQLTIDDKSSPAKPPSQ